jgi:hypothetical protein
MELPLSYSGLRGVMMPLEPRPEPGSLVEMDGRFYHATPATPAGQLRASFYCALEDKSFKRANKLERPGYDCVFCMVRDKYLLIFFIWL